MIKSEEIEGSLLQTAHEWVWENIEPGDTVVDATVGNGHDALFLAKCVGEAGCVIGFDVQSQALLSTRALLKSEGIPEESVKLHGVGHENMAECVGEQVAVVMFNLGYLPGSDKTTITVPETTLIALATAIDCLRLDGVLSIMCYPGHSGGDKEAEAVHAWALEESERGNEVSVYTRRGARPSAPHLIILQKKRSAPQGS